MVENSLLWLLFVISLAPVDKGESPELIGAGVFGSMPECFDARDKLVEGLGRPIIDYKVICVPKKVQGEDI